jgi:hypothetical protein
MSNFANELLKEELWQKELYCFLILVDFIKGNGYKTVNNIELRDWGGILTIGLKVAWVVNMPSFELQSRVTSGFVFEIFMWYLAISGSRSILCSMRYFLHIN